MAEEIWAATRNSSTTQKQSRERTADPTGGYRVNILTLNNGQLKGWQDLEFGYQNRKYGKNSMIPNPDQGVVSGEG